MAQATRGERTDSELMHTGAELFRDFFWRFFFGGFGAVKARFWQNQW